MTGVTPREQWRWYGSAAHFICGSDCRFHLATEVGEYLVSTVGEYFPDSQVREIFAENRGVKLTGRGDDRRADYMKKIGFEEIGWGRKYETMVFRLGPNPPRCSAPDCLCGLPTPESWGELDTEGYNDAGAATKGHYAMCEKWAVPQPELVA